MTPAALSLAVGKKATSSLSPERSQPAASSALPPREANHPAVFCARPPLPEAPREEGQLPPLSAAVVFVVGGALSGPGRLETWQAGPDADLDQTVLDLKE